MCLLHRFIFIVIYLLLIVASSWIFEWILLYETGFTSYQIVEPLRNLSVSQLQAILSTRGIEYSTYLEKLEIIHSLRLSGKVHYEELLEALTLRESYGPKEIFGKDEYYEQVLEESESIWVIEVIPGDGNFSDKRVLDSDSWKRLEERLKIVGIQCAVIRCKNDPFLCKRQDWNYPQLIMAVPKPHSNAKLNLKLSASTRLTVNSVMSWIRSELTKLIPKIDEVRELKDEWLNTTVVRDSKVPHMIYFSEMLNPPLLLVAIGLRFSSRVRMSLFNTRRFDKETVSKTLSSYKLNSPPQLVVTSSDSVSPYGDKKGEYLTTTSLDFYIRLMKPRMNDLFLVSLIVTNFFAFLDFVDCRRSLWKHLVRTLCSVPVYNVFIFISWLTLSAVVKFAWLKPIIDNGSFILYEVGCVGVPSLFLYYLVLIDRYKSLAVISSFLCSAFVWIWRRYLNNPSDQDQDSDNWYSIFPMDSYLVNVLFRPMASLSRPRPSNELDLEEGMERLIQRLATPDLWLHPVISTEYMQDLPIWRYDGWGNEDDLKSESETDFDSLSETENDSLLETHTCCQDDGCKMCTLWATVKETYVCHRCAILKRKLEKKYLKCRNSGDMTYQNITYEKLLKVCENCSRTKKNQSNVHLKSTNNSSGHEKSKRQWLISAQRLHSLKWTAPTHAIESRVCAICLDRYRWSAVLCGLPCGHTYHHSCIMEWLSKDNHQCPTCRWPSYKTKIINSSS